MRCNNMTNNDQNDTSAFLENTCHLLYLSWNAYLHMRKYSCFYCDCVHELLGHTKHITVKMYT